MSLTGVNTGSGVDTSGTSQSSKDQAKLEDDLNRFMNLLVTQLKNQDPLDPMDANEFTSQLVQFANVEQQIYQNANLEKLLEVETTSQIASMVDYIGKKVEVPSSKLPLAADGADFNYEVGQNANQVFINIRNSDGINVFTADGDPAAGSHSFHWDGKDNYGNVQPEGTYTLYINALDPAGKVTDISQTIIGRVTGAAGKDGDIRLEIGDDITAAMTDVLRVTE